MDTRLTRSHSDRMLTGVAGGMAEYFDVDPVIIRLLWVLGAVFTGGVLLIVYFVMAIIMPSPPDDEDEYEDDDLDEEDEAEPAGDETDAEKSSEDQGEELVDDEGEPKAEGAAATAAAASTATASDAPLAESPRQRRREARRERRASRRSARRRRAAARRRGQGAFLIGSVLIGIGALALVDQFTWLSFWQFWPLILIGIGGALILGRMRQEVVMAGNDTHDGSAPARKRRRRRRGDGALVGGTALVLLGSVFLADELGWVEFGDLWPVILIGIGLVMIFTYLADARRSP